MEDALDEDDIVIKAIADDESITTKPHHRLATAAFDLRRQAGKRGQQSELDANMVRSAARRVGGAFRQPVNLSE